MKGKRSRWIACRLAAAQRQVLRRILTASLILAGALHAPPQKSQVSGGISPRSVKPRASSSNDGHPFNNAAGSNKRISVEGRVDPWRSRKGGWFITKISATESAKLLKRYPKLRASTLQPPQQVQIRNLLRSGIVEFSRPPYVTW